MSYTSPDNPPDPETAALELIVDHARRRGMFVPSPRAAGTHITSE